MSQRTQQKLNGSVQRNDASVLLNLPKREGKKILTGEDKLRQIFTENLKGQGRDFTRMFAEAVTEAENITSAKCEIIKAEPEKPNLKVLEDIVVRYFKPCKKNTLFKEVDFDISNDNVLKSEENINYFKMF